jgi:hypothetical protein
VKRRKKKKKEVNSVRMRIHENDGQPHALDIVLSGFHVYVYGPEVPSFGMRVDDALEQRLAPLGFAQFVFQLGKFGDGFEVWAGASARANLHVLRAT